MFRLLTLAFLAFSFTLSSTTVTAQTIYADAPGWNFGIVEQGVMKKKTIVLENRGKRPLKLGKIKVTCGCITAKVDKTVLEPGESTNLVLDLNSYRNAGRIRKYCYVPTNDPKKRTLQLVIDGEIRPDWWVGSKNINFGRTAGGKEYERSFRVFFKKGKTVEVKRMYTDRPCLKVRYEPVFDENPKTVNNANADKAVSNGEARPTKKVEPSKIPTGLKVTVTMTGETAPGSFAGIVTIEMKNRYAVRENIMVLARVSDHMRVGPTKVMLGAISYGSSISREVKVSNVGTGLVVVSEASVEDIPGATAKVRCIKPGKEYSVMITVPATEGQVNLRGSLMVKMEGDRAWNFRVPVQGVARRPRK